MTQAPQQLHDLLQRQRDTARQLWQILDREHTALTGNDLQGLETILAAKQECMARLEAASREYLALSRRQSPSPEAGIDATLRHNDPQDRWGLAALWRQLEELITQCRDKNSANGKIIALNHRHVQQALTILRSGEPGSEPCYDPGGGRPSGAGSRTLGKV